MSISAAIANAGRNRLKTSAIGLGILAYMGAILYSGVRSWDLMVRTLPSDLLGFAVLGILVLELSALALPLALHYWTISGWHRTSAYVFYVADLILVAANAVLDSAHVSGAVLPGVMGVYSVWVVPAMPILVGAGWAVLLALDPNIKRNDKMREMQEQMRDRVHEMTLQELEAPEIQQIAHAAAKRDALEIAGIARAPRLPAPDKPTQAAKPEQPARVEPARIEVADADPKAPALVTVSRNGKGH